MHSWVSYSESLCVFSVSFLSHFLSLLLSFLSSSRSPHPRFTYVLLVKFPCWVLLTYKHVFINMFINVLLIYKHVYCYPTVSLFKFNHMLPSLMPGLNCILREILHSARELLCPVYPKMYQFPWQCVYFWGSSCSELFCPTAQRP